MPGIYFRPTPQRKMKANIDYIKVEETDIISGIDEMNPNRATGLDGFPGILLKN